MPKKAKIENTASGKKFKVVNPNAAGIDIASTEMQVCVPEDRDADCNRTFGCFTQDLKQIADWLTSCHIETVAMESTGVYWLPLYFTLKERGFDVVLLYKMKDAQKLLLRLKSTYSTDFDRLLKIHAEYEPELHPTILKLLK